MTKNRIWELDALRGVCILGMVVFHLIYDMTELYALVDWQLPPFLAFVELAGGGIFLVLSGLCVTLGSRSVLRGTTVFACGMLCTAVTAGMYYLGMAGDNVIIRFGVLHCLGICMLLWPLFKKLPLWALAALGAVIVAAGCWIDWSDLYIRSPWLFPLGLIRRDFQSGDFFPLLPCLGWFLLGAVLGRTLYRKKESLLPRINHRALPLRLLQLCGRHSLWIYLAHQPVLAGALSLVSLLK